MPTLNVTQEFQVTGFVYAANVERADGTVAIFLRANGNGLCFSKTETANDGPTVPLARLDDFSSLLGQALGFEDTEAERNDGVLATLRLENQTPTVGLEAVTATTWKILGLPSNIVGSNVSVVLTDEELETIADAVSDIVVDLPDAT